MQIDRPRGDTYADVFKVTNKTANAPANITGCSFKMTLSRVRNPVGVDDQLYQLIGVITDAEKGIVEFAPTTSQADLVGFFYFDVQMIDANGVVRTLEKDVYQYVQDITK